MKPGLFLNGYFKFHPFVDSGAPEIVLTHDPAPFEAGAEMLLRYVPELVVFLYFVCDSATGALERLNCRVRDGGVIDAEVSRQHSRVATGNGAGFPRAAGRSGHHRRAAWLETGGPCGARGTATPRHARHRDLQTR